MEIFLMWREGEESAERGELWLTTSELVKAVFALALPRCTIEGFVLLQGLSGSCAWEGLPSRREVMEAGQNTAANPNSIWQNSECWLQASSCTCSNRALHCCSTCTCAPQIRARAQSFARKMKFGNFSALRWEAKQRWLLRLKGHGVK